MIYRYFMIAVFLFTVIVSSSDGKELNKHWTVTYDERFRIETWDNAITLDDSAKNSTTYTRTRTRLGTIWSPSPNVTLGLRLTNAFRYYLAPTGRDFSLNEIFVDHLYLKLKILSPLPLTCTIGRQDIMLGEGFIVLDGNPLDGSRSAYFNAVRIDWAIRPNHELIAFACYQEETDDWLPIIHESGQALIERPETGFGLYYRGKWSRRDIQTYLVYLKHDNNKNYTFESNVSTIGGRIVQPVFRSIDLAAVVEAGYQFGENGNNDHRAWGGYAYLRYNPKWKLQYFFLPVNLTAGMIYLSGDNPDTDTREGWDPVFARWPKWSEGYIYTQIKEETVAWWSNLVSFNVEFLFSLTAGANLKLTYHHLIAPYEAGTSSAFPGGDGNSRGELFIGKLSYKFDQSWSGHLLWEYFDPGDFYFDGADSYAWMRAELMYRF